MNVEDTRARALVRKLAGCRQSAAPSGQALHIPLNTSLKTTPHKGHNINMARICVFDGRGSLHPQPAPMQLLTCACLGAWSPPQSAHALRIQARLASSGPLLCPEPGWRIISHTNRPTARGAGVRVAGRALEAQHLCLPRWRHFCMARPPASSTLYVRICAPMPLNGLTLSLLTLTSRPSRGRGTGRRITKTLCHHCCACERMRGPASPILHTGLRACSTWKLSMRERWYSIVSAKPQARALGCERTAHVANRIK